MKKYLMTWYGITDLKASLELEQSTGPVLGALLTEDYEEVVILGFTQVGKSNEDNLSNTQASEIKDADLIVVRRFINQFSNTEEAHTHFLVWLKKQLKDMGKNIKVSFNSVKLIHLNDTEGIYEAATQSLDLVAHKEGEKLVTLYLSPGTPVMAFVWAFAALTHPNLKKRLIAASQYGKPPEEIVLPNNWMEWHGKQIKACEVNSSRYDVIFHLFGDQRIPSLLGINQFHSKKHIFLNSKKFPADIMKQFITKADFDQISVDPYDPEEVRSTILNITSKMAGNSKVGFNLTGGTKLMYAGALAACRKINATPFYFDSRSHQVVNLNDFTREDTKLIESVETFFMLNGDELFISKPGYWDDIADIRNPDRERLTNELWKIRSKLTGLYRSLVKYNDSFQPFQLNHKDIFVELSRDRSVKISIGAKFFEFQEWEDFAKYLSGGWFEEYVFMKLQPLIASGLIMDMRMGLEVAFKSSSQPGNKAVSFEQLKLQVRKQTEGEKYQELDIVFTDGRRLYIVECKSGNIKTDQIMQLQNIVRFYGGVEGEGILASCFLSSNKVVDKKIKDSTNIKKASGENLIYELNQIIKSGVLSR